MKNKFNLTREQNIFFEKSINFYESGNNTDLKQWIYETSIDGINLNKE